MPTLIRALIGTLSTLYGTHAGRATWAAGWLDGTRQSDRPEPAPGNCTLLLWPLRCASRRYVCDSHRTYTSLVIRQDMLYIDVYSMSSGESLVTTNPVRYV